MSDMGGGEHPRSRSPRSERAAQPQRGRTTTDDGCQQVSTRSCEVSRGMHDRTIVLIRHGESTNNVAKNTLSRTLKKFRPPHSTKEAVQLASLLMFPMNSPLSHSGRHAVDERKSVCCQMASDERLEIVLHSPLTRAKDTASMFAGALPLEQLDHLYEKSLSEHASLRSLQQRVDSFTRELLQRPESRMAIVGHSGFFRCMVGEALSRRKHELGNLSVWRVVLGADGVWRDLELLLPGTCGLYNEAPPPREKPKAHDVPICLVMSPD